MSYVTENTKWMSDQITGNTKALLARFYELADSKHLGSDAGHLMATEVFTEDAVVFTPAGTYKGFTEISKSRDNVWATVSSRRHTIQKVFAGRGDNTEELVLFGSLHMTTAKGESSDHAFMAHLKLASSATQPRISFVETFGITTPRSA